MKLLTYQCYVLVCSSYVSRLCAHTSVFSFYIPLYVTHPDSHLIRLCTSIHLDQHVINILPKETFSLMSSTNRTVFLPTLQLLHPSKKFLPVLQSPFQFTFLAIVVYFISVQCNFCYICPFPPRRCQMVAGSRNKQIKIFAVQHIQTQYYFARPLKVCISLRNASSECVVTDLSVCMRGRGMVSMVLIMPAFMP